MKRLVTGTVAMLASQGLLVQILVTAGGLFAALFAGAFAMAAGEAVSHPFTECGPNQVVQCQSDLASKLLASLGLVAALGFGALLGLCGLAVLLGRPPNHQRDRGEVLGTRLQGQFLAGLRDEEGYMATRRRLSDAAGSGRRQLLGTRFGLLLCSLGALALAVSSLYVTAFGLMQYDASTATLRYLYFAHAGLAVVCLLATIVWGDAMRKHGAPMPDADAELDAIEVDVLRVERAGTADKTAKKAMVSIKGREPAL